MELRQVIGDTVILEREEGIACIRLGKSDEKMVLLTEKKMEALDAALTEVQADTGIRGLIITGTQPDCFCAGADINIIKSLQDAGYAEKLAKRGQDIFYKLASLRCRTVAAISGACVGGGCELALACDFRILANLPKSRIGLPEIKLGIIPGFGGTQRLSRLIGIRAALEIILKGKVLSAEKALEMGLVDELVSLSSEEFSSGSLQAALENKAREVANGVVTPGRRSQPLMETFLTKTRFGRSMVYAQARKNVLFSTKGNYPAPLRALDVVVSGLSQENHQGFAEEARALGELVVSPESKALVYVYSLSEETKKRWRGAQAEVKGIQIAVLGAGTMGSGIAATCLLAGFPVVLVDPVEEVRNRARMMIQNAVERANAAPYSGDILAGLQVSHSLGDIASARIVIEAVSENFELKRKVIQEASYVLARDAIIASNTSSLPISHLAEDVVDSGRVIGMHFFNPAERMPLVEIVLTKNADDRTIAVSGAFAVLIGKLPIVVNEVPGFLINRMLVPYLVEAGYALEEICSVTEVDRAAEKFGLPMGPFRLLDEIGLDIAHQVSTILESSYGERMAGPNHAGKLAAAERLGRKTNKGYYRYEGLRAIPDDATDILLGLDKSNRKCEMDAAQLAERIVLPMVNEAVRCLDEGVAGQAGPEAARQIDLGSIMGLGFAPFRGGVICYADNVGASALVAKLEVLEAKYGPRFKPWKGIKARADKQRSFYEAV